jgi:CheY-like chemotaxis protein
MGTDTARVLVIDDDGLLRAVLAMTLQHHGYVVRTAVSAWDGLMSAVAWHPALIVFDGAMPDMSGGEFITALHKRPQLAEVPVLLTDCHALPDAGLYRRIAFLAKPFETLTFAQTVQALLHDQERVVGV